MYALGAVQGPESKRIGLAQSCIDPEIVNLLMWYALFLTKLKMLM